VGSPVASRHKWRVGHGSVATQPTFLQLVRQALSNFALILFNWTSLFHYLSLMAVVTSSQSLHVLKKNFFKQCIFFILFFLNCQLSNPIS
jgi:hypothetical protein